MFNSNVTTWLPGDSDIIMTTSSATSKSAAKEFLKNVTTEGGTNIEMALKEAISTMRKFNECEHFCDNIYIFTDMSLYLMIFLYSKREDTAPQF